MEQASQKSAEGGLSDAAVGAAPPSPAKDAAVRRGLIGRTVGRAIDFVHWLAHFFDPLRKIAVNLAVVLALVVGGPAIYRIALKPTFVIKDISVPSDLGGRGYSGGVVAQQILDRISEVQRLSGSRKEHAAISGVDIETAMPSIQLPVGGFNLNAIVSELRQALGVKETKITGEVFVAVPGDDDKKILPKYGVRLRIAGQGAIFRSDEPEDNIEALIDEAAERVMHQFDPVNLGYYFYRIKRYRKAYETTEAALADDDDENDAWAYSMRGLIARDEGRYRDSIRHFQQAIDEDPKFWSGYVNLSGSLRLDGRLDDAELAARKAIELAPNEHEGHSALALVLVERGDKDGALAEMKRGVALDPKDAGGHLLLGQLLNRLERFEEALASFHEAAEISDSADPLIRAAETSRTLKRDDEAYALLKRATETEPDNAESWIALGTAAAERLDYKDAIAALEKACVLAPHSADGPTKLADVYMMQKRNALALGVYGKFAPALARDPAFLVGWSETLFNDGKQTEAADKLKAAEAAADGNSAVYERIARSLESHGEVGEAIEVYKRAIAADPRVESVLSAQIARLNTQIASHSVAPAVRAASPHATAAPAHAAHKHKAKPADPDRPAPDDPNAG